MEEAVKKLKILEKKNILLLMHHNADIDALASAWVLKNYFSLKNNVTIATCESLAKQTKKLLNIINEEIVKDPDCSAYDFIIVVDTSSYEQVKTAKNLKINAIIDHHEKGDLKAEIEIIDKNAKATACIVYEIMKEFGYELSEIEKKVLLAGIVSDTAHLRFADKNTFKIISELIGNFSFGEVLNLIAVEEDVSDRIATLKAAKRMELYKFNELIVAFSKLGSHEAIAARNLVKLGVDIAIVMTKKDNELRISSRGKEKILAKGINLAEIFKKVGEFIQGSGGGHDLAGSANGKVKPYEIVRNFILKELSKKLGKWKKIKV
ncbi:MAG TPA: bifunctional oligoribonuclease/PAP phosphatase NrnA [Nanoarchaeota archaeon]|nr:bifunctional oligoribonuclease/PAP phosphatase NrnA [Nanoarchaeota archaeon]